MAIISAWAVGSLERLSLVPALGDTIRSSMNDDRTDRDFVLFVGPPRAIECLLASSDRAAASRLGTRSVINVENV